MTTDYFLLSSSVRIEKPAPVKPTTAGTANWAMLMMVDGSIMVLLLECYLFLFGENASPSMDKPTPVMPMATGTATWAKLMMLEISVIIFFFLCVGLITLCCLVILFQPR